ncbi:MAG: PA2779 family protein [Gemmatimonadetes bacterium]|nr:PA2779 family protein [Gemmatimonadota bacterium]
MIRNSLQRCCVVIISLSLLNLGSPVVATAAIIDTGTVIAAGQRDADLAAIRAGLDRADVRRQFEALGVDSGLVETRLATLTDAEVATLAERMEQMPAGGDLLAVIGVVFIILLVLELVGVIDIFK